MKNRSTAQRQLWRGSFSGASAFVLLLFGSASAVLTGCRSEGKVETVKDLPAREKAVNESMRQNYSNGTPGGSSSRMAPSGMVPPGPMSGGAPPMGAASRR